MRNLVGLGIGDILAYDTSEERRNAVAAETGVTGVVCLAEAWERHPGAAVIAAPTQLHLPLALEAAAHGCDLFLEKPLAHSCAGIDRLCAAAAERNLVTMVACNMRFHPGPALIKRLLDEGAIGQVLAGRLQTGSYLPRWRPTQDYRNSYSASPEWGGAILDCIHEIDLALWYFGPATLQGAAWQRARSLGLKTDGLAEMILRHDSGVTSNVHLNFVQCDYRRTCQIIGTDGTIYWDFAHKRVDLYGPEGALERSWEEPEGWQVNQLYIDEMAHFLNAVEERKPTVNPLAGGLAALHIALAAKSVGDPDGGERLA
jgi:predicted dehydrogenase